MLSVSVATRTPYLTREIDWAAVTRQHLLVLPDVAGHYMLLRGQSLSFGPVIVQSVAYITRAPTHHGQHKRMHFDRVLPLLLHHHIRTEHVVWHKDLLKQDLQDCVQHHILAMFLVAREPHMVSHTVSERQEVAHGGGRNRGQKQRKQQQRRLQLVDS